MLSDYFYNTIPEISLFVAVLIAGLFLSRVIYNFLEILTKKIFPEYIQKIIEHLNTPIVMLVFYIIFIQTKILLDLTFRGEQLFNNIIYVLISLITIAFILKIFGYIYDLFFQKKTKNTLSLHMQLFVKRIIKFIIIFTGFIIILDGLQYNITAFVAGLGIGGLALAFAAQDTLKNFFGGITIFLDKPFEIGDRIKLDSEREGFVRRIGLRTTILETFAGTQIIVPNARVSDTILENISRETARRINMTVSLEYKTTHKELEKAKKILQDIIIENKDTEDKYRVAFTEFADSSLNITVIYWIKNMDNIFGARDAINMEIKKRFDKAKLGFAFPTRTIYVKK
ncbi:MAG: mechanosensitive ion channel family protein [Candidatus Woesearchaeota archaeon]